MRKKNVSKRGKCEPLKYIFCKCRRTRRGLRSLVPFLLLDRRPSTFTPIIIASIGHGRTIFSIIATSTSHILLPNPAPSHTQTAYVIRLFYPHHEKHRRLCGRPQQTMRITTDPSNNNSPPDGWDRCRSIFPNHFDSDLCHLLMTARVEDSYRVMQPLLYKHTLLRSKNRST